jgi:hypothetical protein
MQQEDYKMIKSQTIVEEAFNIVNQEPPEPPTPPGARVIHEGLGITYPSVKGEEPLDKNVQDTFHRYFVYILIAMLIGVYVGVTASKIFFSNKMEDAVKVQGMVFKDKIYTITPK